MNCSPIVGSRGCYADCSFCCIYAYAKNADGARYRMRSPENIVAEMEREYRERGVRLFIFHDDNFFVPSEKKNIARYQRMKELIEQAGLADIGLVIKCRPNDVTPALFRLLQSMGVIRAYVGIETNSDEGIVSLNRCISPEDNRRALDIFVQRREGARIELAATSAYPNPRSVDWSVTEGSVKKLAGDQVEWTVPQRAGMYQIEVAWTTAMMGSASTRWLLRWWWTN